MRRTPLRTLAGNAGSSCSCDVASSSSVVSMRADSTTFDEGFRARLGAELADVGWGLEAALFFAFGAIVENV